MKTQRSARWRAFVNRLGRSLAVPWVVLWMYRGFGQWFAITNPPHPLWQYVTANAIIGAGLWLLAWWIALAICKAVAALDGDEEPKS